MATPLLLGPVRGSYTLIVFRAILWRLTVIVVVLCLLGAVILWRLAVTGPGWYRPPDPQQPEVAELADRVEYNLVQQAQQIRPPQDDTWSVRIRQHQVNAWLAARLQAWIDNRPELSWPERLGTPQVRLEEAGVRIAVELLEDDGGSHIASALVAPTWINDPALLAGSVQSVALGRITLPGDPLNTLLDLADRAGLLDRLDRSRLDEVRAYMNAQRGIEPIIELADGRIVELLDFTLHAGALDVTCRTIGQASADAGSAAAPPLEDSDSSSEQ